MACARPCSTSSLPVDLPCPLARTACLWAAWACRRRRRRRLWGWRGWPGSASRRAACRPAPSSRRHPAGGECIVDAIMTVRFRYMIMMKHPKVVSRGVSDRLPIAGAWPRGLRYWPVKSRRQTVHRIYLPSIYHTDLSLSFKSPRGVLSSKSIFRIIESNYKNRFSSWQHRIPKIMATPPPPRHGSLINSGHLWRTMHAQYNTYVLHLPSRPSGLSTPARSDNYC